MPFALQVQSLNHWTTGEVPGEGVLTLEGSIVPQYGAHTGSGCVRSKRAAGWGGSRGEVVKEPRDLEGGRLESQTQRPLVY